MSLSSSEYLHSYLRWPNRSNILFFQYFGSWFNTCKTVDCVKKCGDISYQIKIRSNQARLQFSLWALPSMIKLIIHSQQWVEPELEISLLKCSEHITPCQWVWVTGAVALTYAQEKLHLAQTAHQARWGACCGYESSLLSWLHGIVICLCAPGEVINYRVNLGQP